MDETMDHLSANDLDVRAEALHDYLYGKTVKSQVTAKKAMLLAPPANLSAETLKALLSGIDTDSVHPALSSISLVAGKKDVYYYDRTVMTPQYAKIGALLEDKDILATVASVTRTDSKVYPRPTPFAKLMNTPFRFTMDELLGAAARMQNGEAYGDIRVVVASNGNQAFYSELHLSRQYAQALHQRIEVDDVENP